MLLFCEFVAHTYLAPVRNQPYVSSGTQKVWCFMWTIFEIVRWVLTIIGLLVATRMVEEFFESMRGRSQFRKKEAERALVKELSIASKKPLPQAVEILQSSGISYNAKTRFRSQRWKIPKIFWCKGDGVVKAKALNTLMVNARHHCGDCAPESDLCNLLVRQAKKTPFTVAMICSALACINTTLNGWFDN